MIQLWLFCDWDSLPQFKPIFTGDARFHLAGCLSDFANPQPGATVILLNAGDLASNADDFLEQMGVRIEGADGVIVLLPPAWSHLAETIRLRRGVTAVFVAWPGWEELREAVASVEHPVESRLCGGGGSGQTLSLGR